MTREIIYESGEALRQKLSAAADGGRDVMLRRSFGSEVKPSASGGTRAIDFTISTDRVDRMGDRIFSDAWNLEFFVKNPVVLWMHKSDVPPIGKASNIRVEHGMLKATAIFDVDDLSSLVFEKLKTGFLSATSVGFRPLKWSNSEDPTRRFGIDFHAVELLEFSIVTVPANAEALIEGRGMARASDKRQLESDLRKLGYPKAAAARIAAGGFPALADPAPVADPAMAAAAARIKASAQTFRGSFVDGRPSRARTLKCLREIRADIIGRAEDEGRMPNLAERIELTKLQSEIDDAEKVLQAKAAAATPINF